MIISKDESQAMSNLRVPPHSIEAECSLLGTLLLSNDAYDVAVGLVKTNDFYRRENQQIFQAIRSLIEAGHPADVITVYEQLKINGKADETGGLSYLNSLAQYVPSAVNIRRYAELVRDRSILRNLLSVSDKIAASVFEEDGKLTSEILEAAEQRVLAISGSGETGREGAKTLEDTLSSLLVQLQVRAESQGVVSGIQTGFRDIDKLTGGFQAGDLVVVAGRPSMGKTSLAMNIVEHASMVQKLPVMVFSLEMSIEQLTQRMLGSVGRIDQNRLKSGSLSDSDWANASNATALMSAANVEIQDADVENIAQVRAISRRIARKRKGLGLIVVDYLQLMNGGGGDRSSPENRATEVAQISRGLKLLAKEMKCPVIALSQLNRGVESRPDKRPMMSDIRESGAIEQDADTIMFVYRDEVYTKEACLTPGVAEIIVAKQRNGPIGTVKLAWSPQYTRFDSLAR